MLSRRTFVSLAAASAAAPRLAAAQPAPREAPHRGRERATTSFYEKDNVRIRYQEVCSGFPLLVTPGGGLNSCMAKWPTAVFNPPEEFKSNFRCITMDQRNAIDGESTGPIPIDDPWGAFADDQLGLMDHLGVQKFFFIGYCISGPFALKLMQRALSASWPPCSASRPENPDVMYNSGKDVWAPRTAGPPARPQHGTDRQISAQPLSGAARLCVQRVALTLRSPARRRCWSCRMTSPAHPYRVSVDIASLCPNAEVTVYPWKEPPELKARTINRVHTFLKVHQPPTAMR